MQRRTFLAASSAAAVGMLIPKITRAVDSTTVPSRQYFELRTYHFATAAKLELFAEFMSQTAVPALNRAGIEPVGIFRLLAAENPALKLTTDPLDLRILLPHNSIESFLNLESRLAADGEFQTAGEKVLHALKSDLAFSRYDSTLLLAMEGAPRLIPPAKTEGRVFELRTYESPNQERAKSKLDMFNAGEFAIFNKVGMPGVFFGGAIAGQGLPQLTYMVMHDQLSNSKKHWADFGKDPDWQKLKSVESYKDNVSKVISLFIRPTEGSQI